jgi:hypothetical protein
MLTTGMQNLPEPLARAQAAYHDGTARLAPTSADRLARRVEHFASSVQFVLVDYAGHLIGMGRMTMSFVRRAGRRGPSARPV